MTDNSDGTYSYTGSYPTLGNITASVLLIHNNGVAAIIYDTSTYGTGTPHSVSFR